MEQNVFAYKYIPSTTKAVNLAIMSRSLSSKIRSNRWHVFDRQDRQIWANDTISTILSFYFCKCRRSTRNSTWNWRDKVDGKYLRGQRAITQGRIHFTPFVPSLPYSTPPNYITISPLLLLLISQPFFTPDIVLFFTIGGEMDFIFNFWMRKRDFTFCIMHLFYRFIYMRWFAI